MRSLTVKPQYTTGLTAEKASLGDQGGRQGDLDHRRGYAAGALEADSTAKGRHLCEGV